VEVAAAVFPAEMLAVVVVVEVLPGLAVVPKVLTNMAAAAVAAAVLMLMAVEAVMVLLSSVIH
jgi:hypothetical protein